MTCSLVEIFNCRGDIFDGEKSDWEHDIIDDMIDMNYKLGV